MTSEGTGAVRDTTVAMLERVFLSRQDFLQDVPGMDHETDQTLKKFAHYLIAGFDAFYFICC